MREVLFRGKRVDNGEWVIGYYFHYETCHEHFIITDMSYDTPDMEQVIPETVGQYTGLTDKNGKKIFEGDIVKSKHTAFTDSDKKPKYSYDLEKQESEYGYPKIIYYRNYVVQLYDARYRIKNKNITHYINYNFIYNHEVEVVGNIHDNPELLEDEQ